MRKFYALLLKDLRLDFLQGAALGSLFLYVIAAAYIIYLAFGEVTPQEWIVLFWIMILFSSLQTVLRSFSNEGSRRQPYYYTLVDPYMAIGAKLVYNTVLVWVTMLLAGLSLTLFTGFPVLSMSEFILFCLIGGAGIAICFTVISALAYRSKNQSTLMMVMSFPVIIPIFLPLIKGTSQTLEKVQISDLQDSMLMLIGVVFLMIALAVFLFPFAWKE